MKRILVGIEDKLTGLQIDRILKTKQLQADFTSAPITKESLQQYDVMIVHSSWRLPNVIAFIQNLVITKSIPIIYLATGVATSPFEGLKDQLYFTKISELKMEAELPLAIQSITKYAQEVKQLKLVNNQLKKKLEQQELMTKCKFFLMEQNMTEEQAHKTIIKYAMDHQLSKEVACLQLIDKKKN
jgi:hypothetical protein